jgi:hypothetical protein
MSCKKKGFPAWKIKSFKMGFKIFHELKELLKGGWSVFNH